MLEPIITQKSMLKIYYKVTNNINNIFLLKPITR